MKYDLLIQAYQITDETDKKLWQFMEANSGLSAQASAYNDALIEGTVIIRNELLRFRELFSKYMSVCGLDIHDLHEISDRFALHIVLTRKGNTYEETYHILHSNSDPLDQFLAGLYWDFSRAIGQNVRFKECELPECHKIFILHKGGKPQKYCSGKHSVKAFRLKQKNL